MTILGLHQLRQLAEDIRDRSRGSCDLCSGEIGEEYCAPGQLQPKRTKEGLTLQLTYEVVCVACYRAIRGAVDGRRALGKQERLGEWA